jgi:hypothetical protein
MARGQDARPVQFRESGDNGEFPGWFHFGPGPDGDITNIDLGHRLRRSTWNHGYAPEGS